MSDITEGSLTIIGTRRLSRETGSIVDSLQENGKPVVITRQGKPVAVLAPVDERAVQDIILAHAPPFSPGHDRDGNAVSEGQTRSLVEVAAEHGIKLPADEKIASGPNPDPGA